MKKIALTSLAALVLTMGGAAARQGAYVATFISHQTDAGGYTMPIAVGYGLKNGLRFEIDVFNLATHEHGGGTGFGLGGASVMYDFTIKNARGLHPYIGFGMTQLWYDSDWAGNHLNFAGSAIAGVSYDLSKDVTIDLRYARLFGMNHIDWRGGGSSTNTWQDNEFRAGLRYKF